MSRETIIRFSCSGHSRAPDTLVPPDNITRHIIICSYHCPYIGFVIWNWNKKLSRLNSQNATGSCSMFIKSPIFNSCYRKTVNLKSKWIIVLVWNNNCGIVQKMSRCRMKNWYCYILLYQIVLIVYDQILFLNVQRHGKWLLFKINTTCTVNIVCL